MRLPANAAGPASAATLNGLHQRLAKELLNQLDDRPSADLLHVTRAFLQDNGLIGVAQTDGDRQQLRRVYKLFVLKLQEAIQADRPSSATLSEVRQFLRAQGVTKDLEGTAAQAQALEALSLSALPFQMN